MASSGELPAAERFDWFSDVVSREVMPTVLRTERPAEFRAEAGVLDLEGLRVARFTMSPMTSRRSAALVRRSDPEQYQLGLIRQGATALSQHRNMSTAGAGDFLLWDTSRPSDTEMAHSSAMRLTMLQFPRNVLPVRAKRLDELLARRMPAGHGLAAVLSSFLRSLERQELRCGPRELRDLGTAAVSLTAAFLAQQVDAEEQLPAEVRSQVLLRRIRAFIDHHLGDPELTPSAVAARHHMSLRSLHQLFRGEDEGVHAWIRRRRLERCRAELGGGGAGADQVQIIAARWGFSGPAVFSRCFREAYGMSPSEYRALCAVESGAAN
ncbi:helix-turn-helix domain-containing protein [Streptomyces griseus]|uniref:AraC-like ligand-binding domain-containing protein n=1 Tax=Streptomyces griseus TaxID=1911 RepID=UPI000A4E11D6|nr:helix-turn-helix domain-containing protein [Streptomyces griseus]